MYKCDKRFHLDDLLPLYDADLPQAGLVAIHGEEACYYRLNIGRGASILQTQLLDRVSIHRLKQHRCGGQSAQRFGRIRDSQLSAFVACVAERLNQLYLDNGSSPNIQSLIVLGVGDVKDRVLSGQLVHKLLLARVGLTAGVPSTELSTILPVVQQHLSACSLDDLDHTQLVARSLPSSYTGTGTVYGPTDLWAAAGAGQLKTLIVHADVLDQLSALTSRARTQGCGVQVVRLGNEVGVQLLSQFGGVLGVPWFEADTTQTTE